MIPEQWAGSLPAKNGDSRKGKRDGEKELSTPSPHVDDKKGKKAMVYKSEKGEGKGDWKNDSKIISLGHVWGDSLFKLCL